MANDWYERRAEDCIEKAQKEVSEAIESLSDVVIKEIRGTDSLDRATLEKLQECLNALLTVRQKLK